MNVDIRDPTAYINRFLKIRTKDNRLIPLRFNAAQKKLIACIRERQEAGKPVRIIILKARQLGFSTATEALLFHASATREHVNSLIVAHRDDSTSNLFRMSRLFYEELPAPLKPMVKTSNRQELVFENPTRNPEEKRRRPGLRSRIRCVTAGGGSIGRSDTLTAVHISEYAFWGQNKADTLVGILQAVPNLPDTMVIIESTANGYDEFKARWDAAVRGESDFTPLFFPWFDNPEYAMEPGDTLWSPGELALKDQFGLTDRQLAWRRWCIKNNCAGDEKRFRQEYPATPEEAFISSGQPVFDPEIIRRRLIRLKPPQARGHFTYRYDGLRIQDIQWQAREDGYIRIYREPVSGHPYVIGGDTAGDGSDSFAGQVIDNSTGKQVAVLQHRLNEDLYAKQIFCLGMHYNRALVGIENNFSTFPTRELERLEYPRLYVRQQEDSFQHGLRQAYGFVTTRVTKPIIIGQLVELMRENPEAVRDAETLREMLAFSHLGGVKVGALPGEHDDLVMALAIAYYIRVQQDTEAKKEAGPRVYWSADQYEDYQNADEEGRCYLLEKWGNPYA